MAKLPDIGDGEFYELRDAELVVTDPKVIDWRCREFERMGFSKGEALNLATRRVADLHDVARWLSQGCTHVQALGILAPDIVEPPGIDVERDGEPKQLPPAPEPEDPPQPPRWPRWGSGI